MIIRAFAVLRFTYDNELDQMFFRLSQVSFIFRQLFVIAPIGWELPDEGSFRIMSFYLKLIVYVIIR